ncbi:MAG: hypothetical protein QW524_01250 [Candidatus Woesearchaeota archaeon]
MTFNEKKSIIDELKKYICKNLIGKQVTIRFNNTEYTGIIINETKNSFVMAFNDQKQRKTFIKRAIEIKIDKEFLPGKYFIGTLEKRLMSVIYCKENPLVD